MSEFANEFAIVPGWDPMEYRHIIANENLAYTVGVSNQKFE